MVEKGTLQRQEDRLARRESQGFGGSPFTLMRRLADDMDRMFEDIGFGGGWLSPRAGGRSWLSPRTFQSGWDLWTPDIEVFHRGNELVVKADLPGLQKDDVKVDITEDAITIQGERRREHEEEKEGVYRSERSYGSFHRSIPLPEGAITEQAKATFRDGVLEIRMPAPPEQASRGRRLEISEETGTKK